MTQVNMRSHFRLAAMAALASAVVCPAAGFASPSVSAKALQTVRAGERATVDVGVSPPPDASSGRYVIAPPKTETQAIAEAQAEWARSAAQVLARFRGSGQCTEWAAAKRPDIVQRIYERSSVDVALRRPAFALNFNGGFWDDTARAAGLPTGTTPQPGALVSFDPGVDGADAVYGHVAYVESVGPDGSYTVSEMNAPIPGQVSTKTLPPVAPEQTGIGFIY